MAKEINKTTRWNFKTIPFRRVEIVYEVYSTEGSQVIKSFKRRKNARKFAKR